MRRSGSSKAPPQARQPAPPPSKAVAAHGVGAASSDSNKGTDALPRRGADRRPPSSRATKAATTTTAAPSTSAPVRRQSSAAPPPTSMADALQLAAPQRQWWCEAAAALARLDIMGDAPGGCWAGAFKRGDGADVEAEVGATDVVVLRTRGAVQHRVDLLVDEIRAAVAQSATTLLAPWGPAHSTELGVRAAFGAVRDARLQDVDVVAEACAAPSSAAPSLRVRCTSSERAAMQPSEEGGAARIPLAPFGGGPNAAVTVEAAAPTGVRDARRAGPVARLVRVCSDSGDATVLLDLPAGRAELTMRDAPLAHAVGVTAVAHDEAANTTSYTHTAGLRSGGDAAVSVYRGPRGIRGEPCGAAGGDLRLASAHGAVTATGGFRDGALSGAATVTVACTASHSAGALPLRFTFSGNWRLGVRDGGRGAVSLALGADGGAPVASHAGVMVSDSRHGDGETHLLVATPRVECSDAPRRAVITAPWSAGRVHGEAALSLDGAPCYRAAWANGRPTARGAFMFATGIFSGSWSALPAFGPDTALRVVWAGGDPSGPEMVSAVMQATADVAERLSNVAAAHAFVAQVDATIVVPAQQLQQQATALSAVSAGVVAAACRAEAYRAVGARAASLRHTAAERRSDAARAADECAAHRRSIAATAAAAAQQKKAEAELRAQVEEATAALEAACRPHAGRSASDVAAEIAALREEIRTVAAATRQAQQRVLERRAAKRSEKARADALQAEAVALEAERVRLDAHLTNCTTLVAGTERKLAEQRGEYERIVARAEEQCAASEAALEQQRREAAAAAAAEGSHDDGDDDSGRDARNAADELARAHAEATELRARVKEAGDARAAAGCELEAHVANRAAAAAAVSVLEARAVELRAALDAESAALAAAVADRRSTEARIAKAREGAAGLGADETSGTAAVATGASRSSLEERHARSTASLRARIAAAKEARAECEARTAALQRAEHPLDAALPPASPSATNAPRAAEPAAVSRAGSSSGVSLVAERARRVEALRRQEATWAARVTDAQRLLDRALLRAQQQSTAAAASSADRSALHRHETAGELRSAVEAAKAANETLTSEVRDLQAQLKGMTAELRAARRADAAGGAPSSPPPSSSSSSTTGGSTDWRVLALQAEVDAREQQIAALRAELKRVQLLEVNLAKAHATHKFLAERRHSAPALPPAASRPFHRL